jgi:hypothetical protein
MLGMRNLQGYPTWGGNIDSKFRLECIPRTSPSNLILGSFSLTPIVVHRNLVNCIQVEAIHHKQKL